VNRRLFTSKDIQTIASETFAFFLGFSLKFFSGRVLRSVIIESWILNTKSG
jgi:hypothetical protein